MTNYAVQEQNQDLVSLLAAHFRLLYNPTHAMADAVSMLKMFPGIVGIWPGSVSGGGSANKNMMVDVSGNGLHLTNNGTARFRPFELFSGITLDGSTGYFSHADAAIFDILGTEGHIPSANRGLTIGGWFNPDRLATGEFMIGKSGVLNGANGAYNLLKGSGNTLRFRIYNGTTENITPATLPNVSADQWVFVAGRFTPSTELICWQGDANGFNSAIETTSINAAIQNTADEFTIGATSTGGGQFFDCFGCLFWLSQMAIPDVFISTYFQMTAPLFGISV